MFGKIENGEFKIAPNKIVLNNILIVNPNEFELRKMGYLPVVNSDSPQTDNKHFSKPYYKEEGGQIIQKWQIIAMKPTQEEIFQSQLDDLNLIIADIIGGVF